MKLFLYTVGCIFCLPALLYAQTTIKIQSGAKINNKQSTVNIPTGSFVNDGEYTNTLSPGALNVRGSVAFSNSGITTAYDLNFTNSGSSVLNALVSVHNTATIASGSSVNAGSGNLYLRTDINAGANLVNNGMLTGTLQGLVTNATATTGPCGSYNSTLSHNVSGTSMLYQWESSPDNSIWSPISGATDATYNATVVISLYYHCLLTCNNTAYSQATPGVQLISDNPTVDAGGAVSAICRGATTAALGGSFGGTATAAVWDDGGAGGSFTNNDGTTPGLTTYTASLSSTTPVTLTLTTSGGPCGTTSASKPLTVNPLPAIIGLTTSQTICFNGSAAQTASYPYTSITNSGDQYTLTWSPSGPTDVASFISIPATPINVNVPAGTGTGSYTGTLTIKNSVTGCTTSSTITLQINKLPGSLSASIISSNPVCVGNPVSLSGSDAGDGAGVSYLWTGPLADITTPTVLASAGILSAVLGDAGSYTVTASALGCGSTSANTTALTVNKLPTSISASVSPSPACEGGTMTLTGGSSGDGSGVSYSWAGPVTGHIVSPLSQSTSIASAALSDAGVYTLTATAPGCAGNRVAMSSASVVNALPTVHTFTGGGAYCAGDPGVPVGLTLSQTGVSYQLYRTPSIPVGSPVTGTGSAISFGTLHTTPGVYYAIATNISTLCTNYLSGITISINPLPDTFTVTGGGSYCDQDAGVHVGLNNSVTGINYQLYNSSGAVGSAMTGTGSSLDFGLQTAAGTYSVVATNAITLCDIAMAGTATVTVIPLPNDYAITVTHGGQYCAGDTGVHIGLFDSDPGVNYQLYHGITAIGGPVAGTGAALDFGLQTLGGSYTVLANNPLTMCGTIMSTVLTVTVNLLPTVYDVTGGGNYCVGGPGVHIRLNNSDFGIRYQLFRGATAVGVPLNGTTALLDFGLITVVGTYKVIATDTLTGCINAMDDSAIVTVSPVVVPTVQISTGLGAGDTVCLGSFVTFTAKTKHGGTAPAYVWSVNAVVVSSSLDSTYSYTPAVGDQVMVQLSSNAICATPPVLLDTMDVQVDTPAPPSVFILVTPLTTIKIGQPDTLIAIATNCGSSPKYQWYKNGIIIPGATNAMYTNNNFVNHDSLSVRVITSGGCGGRITYNSVIITVANVGVVQVNATTSDVRLIPNPNKGAFIVKGTLGSLDDEDAFIEVNNMIGQAVYRNKIAVRKGIINEQIQLDNTLANGMYILNLRSATEHKVFHFVIEQ